MHAMLSYFRAAIEQPQSVPPWDEWWRLHEDEVRRSFERADYLNLKFRRLDAARTILERLGDGVVKESKPSPMLSPEVISRIDAICDANNSPERIAAVAALPSAPALQHLACSYNWDDGYAVPTAIANHPDCDLGVALDLCWLAGALAWYTHEIEPQDCTQDWADFCWRMAESLLGGRYRKGMTSFRFSLGVARLHELRKQGVPEVFITDVHGELAAPCP